MVMIGTLELSLEPAGIESVVTLIIFTIVFIAAIFTFTGFMKVVFYVFRGEEK
jgi:hypothetical protein